MFWLSINHNQAVYKNIYLKHSLIMALWKLESVHVARFCMTEIQVMLDTCNNWLYLFITHCDKSP
jgi:hypothetical protein